MLLLAFSPAYWLLTVRPARSHNSTRKIWANAHETRDSIGLELQSVQSSLKLQEIHKSPAILDFKDVVGRP